MKAKNRSEKTRSHNCVIYALHITYSELTVNSTWFLINQPSLWKSKSLDIEAEWAENQCTVKGCQALNLQQASCAGGWRADWHRDAEDI